MELPTVFTYKARELHDPESRWWVVAYPEFAAKTTAFLLFVFYVSYRLSALLSEMIQNIHALDLVCVLSSRANVDELERLLRVTERTDFTTLPDNWALRAAGRCLGPCRRVRGAYYLSCVGGYRYVRSGDRLRRRCSVRTQYSHARHINGSVVAFGRGE